MAARIMALPSGAWHYEDSYNDGSTRKVDMHVNRQWIRSERERRAWSQEQLALAAGIGVRTLQRVESVGVASNETAMALAAVFGCELETLRVEPGRAFPTRWSDAWRAVAAGAAALLLAGGLFLSTREAHAADIQLEVALTATQEHARHFTLRVPEGMPAEARLERELRVVFTPKPLKDGTIQLAAEIYRFDGEKFVWFAGPSVIAREGEDATINLTGGDGKIYLITVRTSRA
jgi:transcriptional regulator with XRE-family HTH domain